MLRRLRRDLPGSSLTERAGQMVQPGPHDSNGSDECSSAYNLIKKLSKNALRQVRSGHRHSLWFNGLCCLRKSFRRRPWAVGHRRGPPGRRRTSYCDRHVLGRNVGGRPMADRPSLVVHSARWTETRSGSKPSPTASSTSPSCTEPTPEGVPVKSRSPGIRVKICEQ